MNAVAALFVNQLKLKVCVLIKCINHIVVQHSILTLYPGQYFPLATYINFILHLHSLSMDTACQRADI